MLQWMLHDTVDASANECHRAIGTGTDGVDAGLVDKQPYHEGESIRDTSATSSTIDATMHNSTPTKIAEPPPSKTPPPTKTKLPRSTASTHENNGFVPSALKQILSDSN